jgi:signal peptidase I
MITKKRNPWLALLLAFFCVPVGYIYAGYPKKGIIIPFLILLLFPASIIFIKIQLTLPTLFILLLFVISLSVTILFDVYKSAKKQPKEYVLRYYNKWWFYLVVYVAYSFILFPLAQNFTKENIIQAYKIPAGSMLPTLEIGDHIFVDKRIYKKQKIDRGEIIVFPSPKDPSIEYLKRVVGVPGDNLEIRDKIVYLNDIAQPQPFILHTDPRILPRETSPRDNFGPVTIPQNSLFVLGDNRDNSFDSRFWGFVPSDTVKGKVVNIYWSWDKVNSKVRWERVGLRIK